MLRDPACNSLAGSDLHALELFRRRRDRNFKGQVSGLLIPQQQGPGLRLQQVADVVHDLRQDVFQIDRRRQSFADLDENFKLAVAPFQRFQQMNISRQNSPRASIEIPTLSS